MSVTVPNGVSGGNPNALCSYVPANATNAANMKYFAEGACPAEIKKALLNWVLSAFNEVIDKAGLVVDPPGQCDSAKFYEALLKTVSVCDRPARNLTASPISSLTQVAVQDCPGGIIQRVSVADLQGSPGVAGPGGIL